MLWQQDMVLPNEVFLLLNVQHRYARPLKMRAIY